MEIIMKADIFFFVTTIIVVLVGLGLLVFLVYAIRIISDVKFVSRKIKEESVEFLQDAKEMREHLKQKGGSLLGIFSLLFGKKQTRKKTTK